MKILFLGDSITEGVGASACENNYVSCVGEMLNCEVVNYGVGGTRIGRQTSLKNGYPVWNYDFRLRAQIMEEKADRVFVFGGTNDSWSNAPLGEEMYEDVKREDLFSVKPAICYFMSRLKNENPNANVVFIANCDIKPEIVDCMKNAAERIGVGLVELSGIEKQKGHPTPEGMKQILAQVLKAFN